ncbi:uncharacterized protein LOC115629026 [Scaptodrosophila lebanonensis]|uniref:Uncharacterized protein LOC115629026 n=1 Tax=Drosophila lebanonensis TaxID=7225 RepID=A0A6J2TYK6_DROLE|nr:uncharacterized protein LOC115629026 [Scaptodrosophila lebanonensis]
MANCDIQITVSQEQLDQTNNAGADLQPRKTSGTRIPVPVRQMPGGSYSQVSGRRYKSLLSINGSERSVLQSRSTSMNELYDDSGIHLSCSNCSPEPLRPTSSTPVIKEGEQMPTTRSQLELQMEEQQTLRDLQRAVAEMEADVQLHAVALEQQVKEEQSRNALELTEEHKIELQQKYSWMLDDESQAQGSQSELRPTADSKMDLRLKNETRSEPRRNLNQKQDSKMELKQKQSSKIALFQKQLSKTEQKRKQDSSLLLAPRPVPRMGNQLKQELVQKHKEMMAKSDQKQLEFVYEPVTGRFEEVNPKIQIHPASEPDTDLLLAAAQSSVSQLRDWAIPVGISEEEVENSTDANAMLSSSSNERTLVRLEQLLAAEDNIELLQNLLRRRGTLANIDNAETLTQQAVVEAPSTKEDRGVLRSLLHILYGGDIRKLGYPLLFCGMAFGLVYYFRKA